jgi:hypothetical protein
MTAEERSTLQGMVDHAIIEKAAEEAGVPIEKAEQVIRSTEESLASKASEDSRISDALEQASEALAPPPGAGRTGLF